MSSDGSVSRLDCCKSRRKLSTSSSFQMSLEVVICTCGNSVLAPRKNSDDISEWSEKTGGSTRVNTQVALCVMTTSNVWLSRWVGPKTCWIRSASLRRSRKLFTWAADERLDVCLCLERWWMGCMDSYLLDQVQEIICKLGSYCLSAELINDNKDEILRWILNASYQEFHGL